MSYQPQFRYYSIEYTYPDGEKVMQGAYADKSLAEINVNLNQALDAQLVEIWY